MRSKTKIVITIIVVAALITAVSLFEWHHSTTPRNSQPSTSSNGKINNVNYGAPTQAQKDAGAQIKEQNMQNSTTSPPTNKQAASSPSTTVTISRLSQVSPGQDVNLRVKISNDITNGQCVATFSQSTQTAFTETSDIIANPTYYSCEPINVSATSFSGGGVWQVAVSVKLANSNVSNIATGSITVQK